MEKKIIEFILILLGIGLAMFAAVKVLSGGWIDLLWVMACLVPFALVLLLGLRNWWPLMAIVIPLLRLPSFSAVLLDKITPEIFFYMAVLAFFVAEICIRHRGVSLRVKYARPMMVVALMITLRLVMDPPGSGRAGASGGLFEALNCLIAGWSFFSLWWATERIAVSEKRLVRWFMLFAVGLFVVKLILSPDGFRYELYHRNAWLFWSFLLGWVAYRFGEVRGRWWVFYVLSMIVMACGVTHAHRKSLIMAGLTCMAAAWIFRVEKKQIVILGIVGVLGLGLVLASGHVPQLMRRTLSTILPREMLHLQSFEQGSYGWRDDFRARNLDLAMMDIMSHPLIGKGFAWSTADVVAMLDREGRLGIEGKSETLSAVGMHHYGFFTLMANVGAIVPWFYAVAGIGVFRKFLQYARHKLNAYPKILVMGISGYFINNLFQWLFNGSHDQMLEVSVALGIMMGLLHKWKAFDSDPEPSSPEASLGTSAVIPIGFAAPQEAGEQVLESGSGIPEDREMDVSAGRDAVINRWDRLRPVAPQRRRRKHFR